MRIDGPGRPANVGKKGGAKRGGGGGFSLGDAGQAQKAAGSAPAGPVPAIDSILALQSVEDPLFAKRKAVRRGQSILEALEDMKADLLMGQVNEGQLNRLMALVQQARVQSNPDLDALIDDIELRAKVELAKLGLFPNA